MRSDNVKANHSERRACMIWTPDGVWLQTYDETGAMRLSYVGQVARHDVAFFCQTRGLDLIERMPGQSRLVPGQGRALSGSYAV